MKLTIPLKENHEALWNWLADHPGKSKYDWPGKETIGKYNIKLPHDFYFRVHTCFACQATPVDDDVFVCAKCPVKWGAKKCTYDGSIYQKWLKASTPKERTKYARLIAKGWKKVKKEE